MYCEYLIKRAKEFPEQRLECLQQFFLANYGILFKFMISFGVQNEEKEDFIQLCYFALIQAADAWKDGTVNSFISYYRRCALHQFYVYKMEMRYPVKLSRSDFRQIEIGEKKCSSVQYFDCFTALDDSLSLVESQIFSSTVWNEVDRALKYRDALLVRRRFQDGREYSEIAKELHSDSDKIRYRLHYILTKLKKNKVLHQLARDAFGIQ